LNFSCELQALNSFGLDCFGVWCLEPAENGKNSSLKFSWKNDLAFFLLLTGCRFLGIYSGEKIFEGNFVASFSRCLHYSDLIPFPSSFSWHLSNTLTAVKFWVERRSRKHFKKKIQMTFPPSLLSFLSICIFSTILMLANFWIWHMKNINKSEKIFLEAKLQKIQMWQKKYMYFLEKKCI